MHVVNIDTVPLKEHDNNLAGILVPKEMTGSYFVELMKIYPGSKMPIHVHDYHQVYIIIDGSAKLRVGEEMREVKGGDTVFLPANVEHETVEAGPDGMRYVVIE